MDKINIIQNKEVIPDTHVFIYQNKRYPFKFDYFKYASKFFHNNQKELEETKIIQLLEEEKDDDDKFTEDTIKKFINFVQGKKIQIDNNNVIGLNFLSKKYEVKSLEDKTSEYIENHQDDLVIKILNENQNDPNFDTELYENIISKNIRKYIKDPHLITIKIPILYRILLNKKEEEENDEIIDFLIKCLDKYGKPASVLFENISFGKSKRKYVNLLIKKYSNKIDFEYITSNIISAINEIEEEISNNNQRHSEMISAKDNEIEDLKNKIEQNQKIYLNELETHKKDADKIIDQLKNENQNLNDKIKINKDQYSKENELNKQNIFKLNDEIKNLKLKIDELNQKDPAIMFEYKEEEKEKFNGIIQYLTRKTGGNIHDNGTIKITSFSQHSNHEVKNLLDLNSNDIYASNKSMNNWICYDFIGRKVKVTDYSIKSDCSGPDSGHLKNCVIEISNDGNSWNKIDERNDCPILNGSRRIGVFHTMSNSFSRYILIRQINDIWGTESVLGLKYIEFYGFLEDK